MTTSLCPCVCPTQVVDRWCPTQVVDTWWCGRHTQTHTHTNTHCPHASASARTGPAKVGVEDACKDTDTHKHIYAHTGRGVSLTTSLCLCVYTHIYTRTRLSATWLCVRAYTLFVQYDISVCTYSLYLCMCPCVRVCVHVFVCAQVVDMFGSGLPVCALSYSCIHELVSDGQTGLLFSKAAQLSQHLQQLLAGFPAAPSELLQRLRLNVRDREQSLRWEENWRKVAWLVLRGVQ